MSATRRWTPVTGGFSQAGDIPIASEIGASGAIMDVNEGSLRHALDRLTASPADRVTLWSEFINTLQCRTVAEIGVWKGEFASKMLTRCPGIGKYIMVDPWRPLERWNKPFNTTNEKFDDVYNQAMTSTALFKDKITVLRDETRSAVKEIENGSLDLVYIDGDHTLRGITIDLIATFEKVKPGGFIGGDDFTANMWQHGRKYEPTLVCPLAVYFAEAIEAEIFILPFNQFLIQKPFGKGSSFSLTSYVSTDYKLDVLSNL